MSVAALAERPAQPDVAAQHDPLPRAGRRDICLCLSSGGFPFRLTDGGDYDNMGDHAK